MRAELLGQVVGAQFELERALAEMPIAARAEGTQQLQALKDLQRQIGTANPAMLHALRADIATAVSIARAAVGQGRDVATTPEGIAMLAEAATASRDQVKAAMENMHRYDAVLQFGPGDSEADYRQREVERRHYIEQQQAKHTPQGDLNAAGGVMGQMVDAKAHGAGDSPEFKAQWDALAETTEKLRAEVVRNGGSTKEFDDRLRTDFRAILKSKGVSDADIDARLAANPGNPLEAVKAYVSNGDVTALGLSVDRAAKTALQIRQPIATEATSNDLAATDAMAEFRSSGIAVAAHKTDEPFAHGVSAKTRVAAPTQRGVSV